MCSIGNSIGSISSRGISVGSRIGNSIGSSIGSSVGSNMGSSVVSCIGSNMGSSMWPFNKVFWHVAAFYVVLIINFLNCGL